MDELEKARLGAETITAFFNEFGADVYGQVLLEVLLEGLINEETLFVFGEPEQEGNETDYCLTDEGYSEFQDDGFDGTEPPTSLGEIDLSDCP